MVDFLGAWLVSLPFWASAFSATERNAGAEQQMTAWQAMGAKPPPGVTGFAWNADISGQHEFIAGYGTNMYIMYRNFDSDPWNRDIVRCTMASRSCSDNVTQTAAYWTKWYNTSSNTSFKIWSEYNTSGSVLTATQYFQSGNATLSKTNKYYFNYTDGKCTVVLTPHWNHASLPWERACEMWVREGSTEHWNSTCDKVYSDICGKRNITIYNKAYCDELSSI